MNKLKKVVWLLLLAALFAGCAADVVQTQDPLAQWLETANIEKAETAEELYAAALNEDMLVIYSTSTRILDVARSFETQYPGLRVRVEHLREGELYDTLLSNYADGVFVCDLILSPDGRGIMANEFLPKNIAVKYVPHDIRDKLLPGNDNDKLMFTGEASVFSYNQAYYSEPPFENIWELTDEKWRGMVYMPNPSRSITPLALFTMFIKHSDEMERAFEDLYGYRLDLAHGENAGREFVRRLMNNDAVIVNSSDEVMDIVGAPGSFSPYIGIIVSSKTRLREIGYQMANHYEAKPFCGVYTPNSIMIAGGSPNINSAKLFIRWLLGETDGQGEGYEPYLLSGAWSVRSDVPDETGLRSSDLNLLPLDNAFMYENHEAFLSFFEELLS